jgi:PPM family protein phosphatase
MELRIASLTDRGRVRNRNDDSVLDDASPLVGVADGMGGHKGGDVASSMALDVLRSWKDRLAGSGSEAEQQLRDAFAEANRTVWDRGQTDEALEGMGTTLTAGWIDGNKVTIAHVGDSRAYLLRGGKFQQLTEDQNVAQDLVRKGRISADEAAASPQRHLILQAIGAHPNELDVDITTVELRGGDRLLFASDGLFGMVRDPERIREILTENVDPQAACRVLIDEANAAGGEDNISAVIVDVVGDTTAVEATADDDGPVVIEKPSTAGIPGGSVGSGAPAGSRRSRIFRPLLVGFGAVIVAVIVAVLFLARPSGAQYVVSAREGKVVVLDGSVGRDDHPAKGHVVRVFHDQPVDKFPATTRADLRHGFAVESITDARRLVARLPRLLGPQETPTPTPKPSPTAKTPSTLPPKSASP